MSFWPSEHSYGDGNLFSASAKAARAKVSAADAAAGKLPSQRGLRAPPRPPRASVAVGMAGGGMSLATKVGIGVGVLGVLGVGIYVIRRRA